VDVVVAREGEDVGLVRAGGGLELLADLRGSGQCGRWAAGSDEGALDAL